MPHFFLFLTQLQLWVLHLPLQEQQPTPFAPPKGPLASALAAAREGRDRIPLGFAMYCSRTVSRPSWSGVQPTNSKISVRWTGFYQRHETKATHQPYKCAVVGLGGVGLGATWGWGRGGCGARCGVRLGLGVGLCAMWGWAMRDRAMQGWGEWWWAGGGGAGGGGKKG